MWPRWTRLMPGDREEGVALQRSPDRERQSPARAQDAARLGERGRGSAISM